MSFISKSDELRGIIPMIICRTHMLHMSFSYDTYKRVYYLMSEFKQQIGNRAG